MFELPGCYFKWLDCSDSLGGGFRCAAEYASRPVFCTEWKKRCLRRSLTPEGHNARTQNRTISDNSRSGMARKGAIPNGAGHSALHESHDIADRGH